MKILVCIKQVPDTTDIKWTENNTIQREGVESIINPYDVYAIEEALKLKKEIFRICHSEVLTEESQIKYAQNDNSGVDTEITVLTMGPQQATEMLKKAIAIGCDKGVLISDKKFAGADTYATSTTLAAAIKSKFPDFDLIICGQFAIDGDTAQTGPSIAEKLNIPQVTFVKELDKCDGKSIYAVRELEEGIETVKVEFPALVCIMKGYAEPTRPTINGIKKAQFSEIEVYSMEDIGLTPEQVGIKGSPTYVSRAFRPEHNRGECSLCTDCAELAQKIKEYGGINE